MVPPVLFLHNPKGVKKLVEFATTWAKNIDPGTRAVFAFTDAAFIPDAKFGPEFEGDLEIVRPDEYAGQSVTVHLPLSQPRTKKVRELRSEGFDNEAIAEALRKKGYRFESIDDPEPIKLPGADKFTTKVALACHGNNRKALTACKDFDELAASLVGKAFAADTRLDKEGFVKVDGKGFVGPAPQPGATAPVVADDRPPLDEDNAPDEDYVEYIPDYKPISAE